MEVRDRAAAEVPEVGAGQPTLSPGRRARKDAPQLTKIEQEGSRSWLFRPPMMPLRVVAAAR